MKNFKIFAFLITATFLMSACNGCRQVPANQIVLNTDNYGKTWNIVTGVVPHCNMPGCYNLYLPATTMGGELSSIQRVGEVGGSARVKMLYTYQWEISDPLKFVTEAKELRGGGDYTSDASLETIEGRLIDRKFHDISGPLLEKESVRSFDQGAYETKLTVTVNKEMAQYGIIVSAISCVPEFGEQLETALDAAQALDFYESIGEKDLGREVIKAKAGAPSISVQK